MIVNGKPVPGVSAYLVGPMTIVGPPDYNYQEFERVAVMFRAAGLIVLSPHEHFCGRKDLPHSTYLRKSIETIISGVADFLILLPGWEKSPGAQVETAVAKGVGLRLYTLQPDDTLAPLADTETEEFVPEFATVTAADREMVARATGRVIGQGEITAPLFDDDEPPVRAQLLDEAKHLVTGDRNNQYGPPDQDFRRSADAMTAYGYRHTRLPAAAPPCKECGARPLTPHETAVMVDCVKTSRIMWDPNNPDHWKDKAGYAACGGECALKPHSTKERG